MEKEKLLEVKNLRTVFELLDDRELVAVNDVSFDLYKKEILGVVGESGSGKSVTMKSVLQLIPNPGKITAGEVLLDGVDILKYSEKQMRNNVRGTKISMIFQEPMTTLNPSYTIGWQIDEVYRLHTKDNAASRHEKAVDIMKKVSIPEPERRLKEYPHQYSGGMQQRAMIAIALACAPEILIADEPTTALDVTVQADIMDLLEELRAKEDLSILLISHNLNLVMERSDRIMVMYAGRIVEIGKTEDIAANPLHPYTKGLMNSIPDMDNADQKLTAIPGELPDLAAGMKGCLFSPRCPYATEQCKNNVPEITEIEKGHFCRCHLVNK